MNERILIVFFRFSNIQDRKKYPNLRKVRITVVDNYQGEDNKIILLSLVRSNAAANIGYLAFKNRICVALSRAKHGMYVIGNMTILRKASSLWNAIGDVLETQSSIGTELGLKCMTHQNVHQVINSTRPPFLPHNNSIIAFVFLFVFFFWTRRLLFHRILKI